MDLQRYLATGKGRPSGAVGYSTAMRVVQNCGVELAGGPSNGEPFPRPTTAQDTRPQPFFTATRRTGLQSDVVAERGKACNGKLGI